MLCGMTAPDDAPNSDDTIREMERERDRLDADIKTAREELRDLPGETSLDDEAGDWREADETGHNEEDEARG
jgi:hypothetical protein